MMSWKDPEARARNARSAHRPAYVEWATRRGSAVTGPWLEGPRGCRSSNRRNGRLVAIDLNRGEIRWTAAIGNGPRDHPAIKHLNLPPVGQGGRVSPLVTRTLVFLARAATTPSSRCHRCRRQDVPRLRQVPGRVVWETELAEAPPAHRCPTCSKASSTSSSRRLERHAGELVRVVAALIRARDSSV
jgi:hypothetical protein